ncbi:hypothetical protein GCM10009808_08240 [Microbacterium sediminicola]|uniref:PH domain-containing protein n=1 Tax=Microbacterium sediminicola TaxID=415210 RepID=A0ABN2HTV5_9MICO
MSREGAALIMMAVAAIVLALIAWGWWRRVRRDARMQAPTDDLPADAAVLGRFDILHVATTRVDEPLERLTIAGLRFRATGTATITTAGVVFDLAATPRISLRRERLDSIAQSTVAIDRVVEKDGLVRVRWHLDAATDVDTYLRPRDISARELAEALRAALPTGTTA